VSQPPERGFTAGDSSTRTRDRGWAGSGCAFAGGTGLVAPASGSQADAVVGLTRGTYVLLCLVPDPARRAAPRSRRAPGRATCPASDIDDVIGALLQDGDSPLSTYTPILVSARGRRQPSG
jgi:hypothetical protein